MKKIWLVDHPITKYHEDVIKLATQNNLVIVNPKCGYEVDKNMVEQSPPKLTLKEQKPIRKKKVKNDCL